MAVQVHSDPNFDYADLLSRCEETIGYRFNDRALLKAAFTHASGAEHRLASNERLEFFGDAILGAVVCEALYRRFPDYLEGELTRVKSMVVSRRTCAKISDKIGLKDFLILGKGMTNHAELPPSLLSDVFESLVAAIYLDGGNEVARDFIHQHLDEEIEAAAEAEHGGNFKSLLQQLAQRDFGTTPIYQLLDEKGPDHSKCFKIAAKVATNIYAAAWGKSKKESEQRAAHNAINQINGEEAPYPTEDPIENYDESDSDSEG